MADALAEEVGGAVDAGLGVDDYFELLSAGVSHSEALEVAGSDIDVVWYRLARAAGSSHVTALDAWRQSAELLYQYRPAWEAGASHAEILDAYRAGALTEGYVAARCAGVSHSEALAATGGGAGWPAAEVRRR